MTTENKMETKVEDKVTETVEKVGKKVENVLDKLVENQTRLVEAAAMARSFAPRDRRIPTLLIRCPTRSY
jgi:hypothetical protein